MKLLLLLFNIFNFQDGDLPFQDCECGAICDAIEDVTELNDNRRFSHMAMVVKESGELRVIEANVNGVKLVHLDSFLTRYTDSKGNPRIAVGRLKNEYKSLIPQAIAFSKSKLGMNYDFEFIPNNDKYYCSELIYEAFEFANNNQPIFTERPMTFKKYRSNAFHPVFKEYYKDQNKEIPEGKMGTNPAGISRENVIRIFYLYK